MGPSSRMISRRGVEVENWKKATRREEISTTRVFTCLEQGEMLESTTWKEKHFILFSCSVVSSTLRPREEQHTRLPCPSLSPRIRSNSYSLSQWCHPTIPSSVTPSSCCLQSFPASQFFPMSWIFASSGQSIGTSASIPVLPMNLQGWFSLELTSLISLLS